MTVLAQRRLVCYEHGRVFRKSCLTKEHRRPPSPTPIPVTSFPVEFKNFPVRIMVAAHQPCSGTSTFAYLTLQRLRYRPFYLLMRPVNFGVGQCSVPRPER